METFANQRVLAFVLALAFQASLVAADTSAQETASPVRQDFLVVEQVQPSGGGGMAVRQIGEEPPPVARATRSRTPAKKRAAARRQAPQAGTRVAAAGASRSNAAAPASRSLALDFGRKPQDVVKLPSVREGLSSRIGERN